MINENSRMAEQWAQLRHHCVPINTPEPIVEDMQLCFYIGAGALFNLLREDIDALSEIYEEVNAFIQGQKGRSYVGSKQ